MQNWNPLRRGVSGTLPLFNSEKTMGHNLKLLSVETRFRENNIQRIHFDKIVLRNPDFEPHPNRGKDLLAYGDRSTTTLPSALNFNWDE